MCTKGTPFLVMGIITIIGSIIAIAMQATASSILMGDFFHNTYQYTIGAISAGVGLGCSVIFFITGLLSVVIGKRLQNPQTALAPQKGLAGAVLGMSIASLLFSVVLIAYGSSIAGVLSSLIWACNYSNSGSYDPYYYTSTTWMPNSYYYRNCLDGSFGIGIVLALMALNQFAVSISMIVYSSIHLCRRSPGVGEASVVYSVQPGYGYPNQQVFVTQTPGPYGVQAMANLGTPVLLEQPQRLKYENSGNMLPQQKATVQSPA